MKKRFTIAFGLMATYLLVACGGSAEQTDSHEAETEMHEEHDEHADHDHAAMEEAAATAEQLTVPEGAKVFFANLEDGQTVSSPLNVAFGLEGMEVEPAGELNEGMGHHHIIINGGAIERGAVVPADETNIHFGKGQLETSLELPAGEHTLTLQFADGYHQSYGEQMSASITVVVE